MPIKAAGFGLGDFIPDETRPMKLRALNLMRFHTAFRDSCSSGDFFHEGISFSDRVGERREMAEESWLHMSEGRLEGMSQDPA